MPILLAAGRHDLADDEWRVLEALLPRGKKPGRPPRWSRRQLVGGIHWRVRAAAVAGRPCPLRSLAVGLRPVPSLAADGTWREVMTALRALADASGHVTGDVFVDSATAWAHQQAVGARKDGSAKKEPPGRTGGPEPAGHALDRSRGGLTTKGCPRPRSRAAPGTGSRSC